MVYKLDYPLKKRKKYPEPRFFHESFENGETFLRPEIQLLYKGGSPKVREKDFKDLQVMLPYLLPEQRDWLKMTLNRQFPTGHSWLDYI